MNQVGLIFDGDDTLWKTQLLYDQAIKRFISVMEFQGFNPYEAKQQFDDIEINNARILGFSKLRFPKSMTDTYERLCRGRCRNTDESVKLMVESIGNSAFRGRPQLFDGVQEVLEKLRELHLILILATKGDYDIQEQKVFASGLRGYFKYIYILKEKSDAEILKIVKETGIRLRESWSVGNSVRSDINPAIRIGMKAVWIPNTTWNFEEEVPIADRRLSRVNSIKDVVEVVMRNLGVEA